MSKGNVADVQTQKTSNPATGTVTAVKPFQIRGRFFTAVALRLSGDADGDFYDALEAELAKTRRFFADAPFVIDLEQATELDPGDGLTRLVRELRERGLAVFGVQNGTAEQTKAALAAGLISLPSGREVPLERVEITGRAEPAKVVVPPKTKVITTPVRSGQTIVADRGDLVVVASVSAGAELVAAGSIHVYGHLRGRAMAGVHGDESARIFCQSLDADLLAVAGLYLTSEDIDPAMRKTRVQALLRDEKLCLDPLI